MGVRLNGSFEEKIVLSKWSKMGVLKMGVFLDSSRHTQAFSKIVVLGKAVFTPGIQLVFGPVRHNQVLKMGFLMKMGVFVDSSRHTQAFAKMGVRQNGSFA